VESHRTPQNDPRPRRRRRKVIFCVQGVISPLLANIFLHYALDLWVRQWMRRAATGPMRLARYADDFLLTFERRADADRMATTLAERLAKFGLRLHEDKTRLIEFGRFAATNRRRRSEGRPETFDFLGFSVLQRHVLQRHGKEFCMNV
jgi:retron-type reverse transcriptase